MAIDYGTGSDFSVTMAGPFGSLGRSVRLVSLTLPQANWKGAVSPFSQSVKVNGISIHSKVDLLPSYEQLEAFRTKELAFTTENVDGLLTVYAIGDRPNSDLTFQAAITEVTV